MVRGKGLVEGPKAWRKTFSPRADVDDKVLRRWSKDYEAESDDVDEDTESDSNTQ